MPVGGEVTELNAELEDQPELVNSNPYGKGWLIKVAISDAGEINGLLSAEEYQKIIGK